MGRKPKFTEKSLRQSVDRYFLSISRRMPVMESVPTGKLDSYGHTVYEQVPVLNGLGEPAMVTQFLVPPTVEGLCGFLGIHRSTWASWCAEGTFSDTTAYVRGRMLCWREEQVLTRKDVKGLIFDLENNYGYSERKKLELEAPAGIGVKQVPVPLQERKALLEEIAREFGSEPEN